MQRIFNLIRKFLFHPRFFLKKFWSYYRCYGLKTFQIVISRLTGVSLYQKWHDTYDFLSVKQIKEKEIELRGFNYQPKISIIVPIYNTNTILLNKMIKSVLEQIYNNWELCLVDDASTNKEIKETLKQYENNPKIKIKYRTTNGHISKASNDAVLLADGEYIALMDHDDELCPHALFEVVKALQNKPKTKFIYTDEDKIDINGKLLYCYCKAPFNLELLRQENYLCHFTLLKKDHLVKVGEFNDKANAAQDWDIFFRAIEGLNKDEILYIPKILYHWRMVDSSVSNSLEMEKLLNIQKDVVQSHLKRLNLDASAVINMNTMRIAVRYNTNKKVKIKFIHTMQAIDTEVIESIDSCAEEYICISRNDFLPSEDWTIQALGILQQLDVAAVCTVSDFNFSKKIKKTILSDFASIHDGLSISVNFSDHKNLVNDFYPSIFCYCPFMLIKKDAFTKLSKLDIKAGVFFDIDMFLSLQDLGYRVVNNPLNDMDNIKFSTEFRSNMFKKNIEYMKEKWGKRLFIDRYYYVLSDIC